MITGHGALALIAGTGRRRPPILLLVVAAYAPDILEAGLHHLGIPDPLQSVSHGMLTGAAMAAVFAGVWWLIDRDWVAAGLLALLCLSHIPADYLTGFTKPTWPGGPYLGLGMYGSAPADFAMEATLMAFALPRWARARPGRPIPTWLIWTVTLGVLAVQAVFSLRFSGNTAVIEWMYAAARPAWSPLRLLNYLLKP